MKDSTFMQKRKEAAKPKGKWIGSAIKHPGALHEEMGIPKDEKIPRAKLAKAAKKSGKIGKRGRLAETLEGLSKKRK